MKKFILISSITFLSFGVNILYGQSNTCGTYISNSQKSLETKFTITEGKQSTSLLQVNKTIDISVFVVKEQNPPYFDATSLNGIIANLNQYFSPIALSFKICSTTTINNFQFDHVDANGNAKELTVQFGEQNTINLFLVTNITDQNGMPVCGYTYMPGDTGKNYIFMAKDCIQGITLAHQLGHFFNLYHTDETAFGLELPDGTNCTTTGDRCCDTNASPDLSIDGTVSNCIYTGTTKRSNQIYSPSTKNIMALSPVICRCTFSRTQFLRIIYALNNFRTYLR